MMAAAPCGASRRCQKEDSGMWTVTGEREEPGEAGKRSEVPGEERGGPEGEEGLGVTGQR